MSDEPLASSFAQQAEQAARRLRYSHLRAGRFYILLIILFFIGKNLRNDSNVTFLKTEYITFKPRTEALKQIDTCSKIKRALYKTILDRQKSVRPAVVKVKVP